MASLKFSAPLGALALVLASGLPSHAQESILELPGRGLTFPKPANSAAAVTVTAMEVRINPSVTMVHYKLTNGGAATIKTTLSVSLPTLDFSDPDVAYAIPAEDPTNFIGLAARVDGKPAAFTFVQKASLNDKNISATLRQNKLDLIPIGTFQNAVAALTPQARQALADAGLIVESGTDADGNALYFPSWTVETSASRAFVFDPTKTVDIELTYKTSVGSSPDTVLRKALRTEPNLSGEVTQYRQDYCIDDSFYAGLDKIAAAATANIANTAKIREKRIQFDLLDGAPPAPIGDFRLTVDKERPDRVVSFCLDNLKRINPTTFEMRASNFTPTANLKILILGRE
ncbi:MAG TPA: DUF4424 family protein [Beijerinckiaceae bacterium]|jgi:hypothetical protein|nr:DUF4424 family protein [Beijerinckiaceae bacterium]